MKFNLILEDKNGEKINMTTTANQYMVSKIEGLNPPASTISTSSYAGMDGSYLNNAFIEKRNIVIHFEMRGIDIEKRRHLLYKVVKPSRYIKIYYRTANIDVYAEGYVETCEVNHFEEFTSGQISILCTDIYWYDIRQILANNSEINGAFHFPFPESDEPFPLGIYSWDNSVIIENDGEEIGFTILLENIGDESVQAPTIQNADTGEYLRLNATLEKGDIITISTKTGNKTVTLTRNGIDTNLINTFVLGSTWLQLKNGRNTFNISSLHNIQVSVVHTNAYLGV